MFIYLSIPLCSYIHSVLYILVDFFVYLSFLSPPSFYFLSRQSFLASFLPLPPHCFSFNLSFLAGIGFSSSFLPFVTALSIPLPFLSFHLCTTLPITTHTLTFSKPFWQTLPITPFPLHSSPFFLYRTPLPPFCTSQYNHSSRPHPPLSHTSVLTFRCVTLERVTPIPVS